MRTVGNMAASSSANPDIAHGSAAVELTSDVSIQRRSAAQRRLQWVDQAKGIGIVLVVYGHVMDGVRAAGIAFDAQTFKLTWDALYAFHIPLFFFLSGLFFPHSLQRRGPWGVVLEKVNTLVYPYILWSLLQGFAQVALSHHVNNPVTAGEVLSLLWRPRQEFWFLYALFFTYLFGCILYAIVPQRARAWLLPAAIGVYCAREWMPRGAAIWYPTLFQTYFFAGALIPGAAELVVGRSAISLAVSVAVFAAAEILLQQLAGVAADLPYISALHIIAAGAGIAATIALSALFARWGWRFVALIGRMSLQIYLLHTTVAAFARILLLKGLGIHNLQVHLIVGTAAGVLIPLAFAYLLELWNIQGVFALPERFQLAPRRATA